jgi:hypothetical protein
MFKKRTLLLQNGDDFIAVGEPPSSVFDIELPPGCPPLPNPNDFGNPQNPGDPGWDEFMDAMDKWHDLFDDWNDAGRPGPSGGGACGPPQGPYFYAIGNYWQAAWTDPTTGERYMVNSNSSPEDQQAYQNALANGWAVGPYGNQ